MSELRDARDVVAVVAAAGSAAATFISHPQWPTAALILMVLLMGYVIWRMLCAILERMGRELEDCRQAHAECSARFQEVLDLLARKPSPRRRKKNRT